MAELLQILANTKSITLEEENHILSMPIWLTPVKLKVLLIFLLLVIVWGSLFTSIAGKYGPVIPVSAAQSLNIQVTGSEDNTTADDKITLREAVLIIHNNLNRALTTQEQALITGNLKKAKFFNILVAVDLKLDSQLPDIITDHTVIESSSQTRRIIDGQNKVAFGFFVKAAHFDASTLEFRNFTLEEIHIEPLPAPDHDFTILGVKFTDGKKGLVIKEPAASFAGKKKVNIRIIENEFTNLKDDGLTLSTAVTGKYDIKHNNFANLNAVIGAKLQLGGGLGDLDITYEGNTHQTNNGIGSSFDEINHNGKIKWEIDNNHWLGGKTGLETHFILDGQKNFSNNEYKFHTKAGLVLKTEPLNNVLLKVNLDAESIKQNNVGWSMDVKGRTEISTRLFDVLDNTAGVDGFVAVNAQGFWKDRNSKFNTNAEVGIRMITVGAISFDLFYRHDLINQNGKRGFDVRGFHDSLHIDDSEIISNGTNGIAMDNTHSQIRTSLICFNHEDGIHITGDSDVTANRDIIDLNGPPDVNNLSVNYVDATHNGWGPETADEMNRKPYPSNISVIDDVFDQSQRGFVEYFGWNSKGCQPTSSPSPTPSPTPSPSPTITPFPTISPSPSSSPSPSPIPTPSPTTTPLPTFSPSPTPFPSPT